MIPTAAPTCGPKVIALKAPSRAPRIASPTIVARRPPPEPIRTAAAKPIRPDQRAEEQPDDERPHAGSTFEPGGFADRRVGLVRPLEAQRDAQDDGDDDADDERPTDPAGADPGRQQPGRHGDRGEREDPVEDAPADRTEQPLPEEQRRADDRQEGGHDDDDDRDGRERRDPADLAGDRRQFGLRQVDMGLDQADRGVACREELGPQAAGGPARVRTRRGWGRGSSRGRPPAGEWAPGGRGVGSMIPVRSVRVRVAAALRSVTGATLRSMASEWPRHLLTAEILSIGTELTVGDTRDTNAGELARGLTALGVRVGRLTALPDDLDAVTEAFRAASPAPISWSRPAASGPTPDDLTREAIAAAVGETPAVDPGLEAWLRELWSRRGMPFPELNLKQAWLIPSARPLPNPNGTAPGWFVARADGRVIVALPGPPREMRPMWADHALPVLRERGLGAEVAARTYRLAGIGESQVAERLGEALLRATNPIVATYARVEAVDVRISAIAEPPRTRRRARRRRGRHRPRPPRGPRLGDGRNDLERGHRRASRRTRLDARRRSRSGPAGASASCWAMPMVPLRRDDLPRAPAALRTGAAGRARRTTGLDRRR